ncbi:hypothetical protein [Nocardioides sp. YIM 152315]|uniref:hypothetical protein n=1 Tax=Nocardioides sp. YIM 152315 TaxID=3031760 RepID=UPI0023DC9BD2|nr:hypothetical protein [Nocardioides sp. YIM 152315]MDF1604603.1 hypothetical protein [Nocardioides sp. YIM 152315]
MTRRVYLHVGAPKTGTTYLQDRLSLNSRSLAAHDIHFPGGPTVSPALFNFRAALDLLGQDWGGPAGHAEGGWSAMVRKVRRRSGTVVISHEVLAPATSDQVARAMRDLAGSEIHVVYTVRDLARQVPAAWQESIKQGRAWTYEKFLERMTQNKTWFSRAFDLPRVLGTWGAGLPPERVHVVTVPQSGDERRHGDPLWKRMCEVLGIDLAWAPLDSDRSNRSLGRSETQVIRQLNKRMKRATRHEGAYDELIRNLLDQGELVRRESAAVRLPPDHFDWAEERAERWIEWIQGSGVHLVGDVEELRPVRPDPDERYRHPDRVGRKRQLDTALNALAAMTREAARRPDPDRTLASRVRTQAERLRER